MPTRAQQVGIGERLPGGNLGRLVPAAINRDLLVGSTFARFTVS